jgi:ATP-dependent DNA ligase I
MRLADLVSATAAVAATRSRNEKVEALAAMLAGTSSDEMPVVVGLVSGDPRQGRIGVGWATLEAVDDVPPSEAPSLTVADVDHLLDSLAATRGPGSQDARTEMLDTVLRRATADEADFLRRLLIGELRQGANAGIVTEAVARATEVPPAVLRRAVMLSGDLRVASEIASRTGRSGLEAVGLVVMRPVQPMLASTAAGVIEALEQVGEASVEWKLDGIRVQVHRDAGAVRVWTRNLNEITERVPGVVRIVERFPVGTVILDGEVLGLSEEGEPLAFQDTVSTETAVTPFFFDVLHVDGRDLIDLPLRERRDVLEAIAGSRAVPGVITSQPHDAAAVLDEALGRGHEGVVVKDVRSVYLAGRRGKAWLKIKPVHTLDLVVLAVEHGSGRRRGRLSNIHLGARDPATGSFVMVGKTFKGMTDEMLAWQTERFGALALDDDGRTVTVRPEQVVEIAVDGVQRSTRYPGGVALRFARVVRYRTDKDPGEADTIDAVRALG